MFLNKDIVFLINKHKLKIIINKLFFQKNVILEIGSGSGVLSYGILSRFLHHFYVLIDLNLQFCNFLSTLFSNSNFFVLNVDFLSFDFLENLFFTIVGNIPYSISKKILFKLLCYRHCIVYQYLMLQKEIYFSIFIERKISYFIYNFYYFFGFIVYLTGIDFFPVVFVNSVFFVLFPKFIPNESFEQFSFIISNYFSLYFFLSNFRFFNLALFFLNRNLISNLEFYFCMLFYFRNFFFKITY